MPLWELLRRLPARMGDLDDNMKAVVGLALDRNAARLALDLDGTALVLRGRP
jgi:hypothetical protein